MIHPLLSIQAHIQTFLLKHFKYTPYGRYMAKIRNSHLGESCFIIGNGPSLTVEDLDLLAKNNVDTFAVNRIYQIFPKTTWRPTYFVSTDHIMIKDKLSDVNDIPAKIKFIPLQNKYYLGINVKGAAYFFRNDLRENDPPDGFSLDCTEQVNMRGTVTIDCMQLAMHLGYKHIYLLGIDHNFDKIVTEDGEVIIDPSVKNYFIEGYDDDVATEVSHNLGNTTRAYYDVRRFIDKTDVHIYNASRQTKLDAFERVTFEEALAQIQERNAHK
jgi:hypothetical protein